MLIYLKLNKPISKLQRSLDPLYTPQLYIGNTASHNFSGCLDQTIDWLHKSKRKSLSILDYPGDLMDHVNYHHFATRLSFFMKLHRYHFLDALSRNKGSRAYIGCQFSGTSKHERKTIITIFKAIPE